MPDFLWNLHLYMPPFMYRAMWTLLTSPASQNLLDHNPAFRILICRWFVLCF